MLKSAAKRGRHGGGTNPNPRDLPSRSPTWIPYPVIILLIFAPTFATIGCSEGRGTRTGGQRSTQAAPPAIRDSAGIRIVENSEPQWASGSEWRVGPLLTSIGDATRGPAHELFRARDAIRQSDGTVVVVNSDSGEIRFFDQHGTFLRTVGSTGGGPGEFRGASALRALERVPGDTLIAWDIYGQSVSVFSPLGAFVRSFGLDGSGEQRFYVGGFADGSLLMKIYRHAATESRETMPEGVIRPDIILHHYDTEHQLADTIPGTIGSDQFQARWGDYGMMMADAPFGRVTSVGVGGARAYVSTGDANEILAYRQSGALEMSIRRLLEPVPVSAEMISRDRAARVEEEREFEETQVEPRVMRMIAELPYPEILPPHGLTVLDSELNLWVEEFRTSSEAPADWSVFDPEGVWLGRVTLPEGLEIFEIGADYILGRWRDEFEVEYIMVYELVKGSTG